MNGVNILFVISCIFVPLLLISINYSTIHDFYEYSVPLNNLELERSLAKNEQKEGFFYGPTFNEIFEISTLTNILPQ